MSWKEKMRDDLANNGVYERCTSAGIMQNEKEWMIKTIERQQIMIDKMKCCRNCKFTGPGEDFESPCNICNNHSEWEFNE